MKKSSLKKPKFDLLNMISTDTTLIFVYASENSGLCTTFIFTDGLLSTFNFTQKHFLSSCGIFVFVLLNKLHSRERTNLWNIEHTYKELLLLRKETRTLCLIYLHYNTCVNFIQKDPLGSVIPLRMPGRSNVTTARFLKVSTKSMKYSFLFINAIVASVCILIKRQALQTSCQNSYTATANISCIYQTLDHEKNNKRFFSVHLNQLLQIVHAHFNTFVI